MASDTETGISYNIGSLYGAGLFCTSLVIAFTIYLSPTDIKISHQIIYRDVGFYLIATLLTYLFAAL